jgi:hypothetical protein
VGSCSRYGYGENPEKTAPPDDWLEQCIEEDLEMEKWFNEEDSPRCASLLLALNYGGRYKVFLRANLMNPHKVKRYLAFDKECA